VTDRSLTGKCSSCGEGNPTFHYHAENLEKIELCKACYDVYLAKEMTQYWKSHIEEEKARTRGN
tara:strand:+ start:257 stop:448 length:192 start_codon:yes stop_codon:yes gene_type:complete